MGRPTEPFAYTWTSVDQDIANGRDKWGRVHVTPYMVHKSKVRGAGDVAPGSSVTIAPGDFDSTAYVSLWLPDGFTWIKVPDDVQKKGYTNIGELCAKLVEYSNKLFPRSRYDSPDKTPSGGFSTAYLLFHYWGNTDYRYQSSLPKDAQGTPKIDWSKITPDVETKVSGADGKSYELVWVLARCSQSYNTCVVPGKQTHREPKKPADPPAVGEASDWFLGSRTVWQGNAVKAFLYAKETWGDYGAWGTMSKEFEKAVDPETHFIYLTGWAFSQRTEMIGGTTVETLLDERSSVFHVPIRAMFYFNQRSISNPVGHMPFWGAEPNNGPGYKFINQLKTGKAIHDQRYLNFGSHHQKMVVVSNREGLVGFCGGIDIEGGRTNWHDCHLMIKGPAVEDMHRTFHERWTDHPDGDSTSVLAPGTVRGVAVGNLHVQILRTYGDGSKHAGLASMNGQRIGSSTYAFASGGERSIYNFLIKAIEKTQKFIYLEDQYLIAATPMAAGPSISSALAKKVAEGGFKKLVIFMPRTEQVNDEQFQMWERRRQFIQPLLDAGSDKVLVCQYKQDPAKEIGTEQPRYVHSKTWIFDDKVLFTGSANCNRRSYTHDSEVGAAVFDENADGDHLYFAHHVRMRIWRMVLDPKNDHKIGDQDLIDPIAASKFWESPPEPALIERYDVDPNNSKAPNKKFDTDTPKILGLSIGSRDKDWDLFLDPDGS